MKVQECPYTKKLLEQFEETNDTKEKEKLIASIRSRICGSSTDRTVCCDVDNYGDYLITYIFRPMAVVIFCLISFSWILYILKTFCKFCHKPHKSPKGVWNWTCKPWTCTRI